MAKETRQLLTIKGIDLETSDTNYPLGELVGSVVVARNKGQNFCRIAEGTTVPDNTAFAVAVVKAYQRVCFGDGISVAGNLQMGSNAKIGTDLFVGGNTVVDADSTIGRGATFVKGLSAKARTLIGAGCYLGLTNSK